MFLLGWRLLASRRLKKLHTLSCGTNKLTMLPRGLGNATADTAIALMRLRPGLRVYCAEGHPRVSPRKAAALEQHLAYGVALFQARPYTLTLYPDLIP